MADRDQSSVATQIIALVDAARKEARDAGYREGWDAAIRNVVTAAAQAGAPNPASAEKITSRGGVRAPWGSTNRAIDIAFDEAESGGDGGIVIADAIDAGARTLGHELAESSVRGTLGELRKRGEVHKHNGRWFRVKPEAAELPQNDSPAASLAYQGGSHA